jgi:signal transduction histidine kinase
VPTSAWRFRLVAVVLPALLAGTFEFLRHGLAAFAGMPEYLGNLITAGLALVGGLVYFHTVSRLVFRLAAAVEGAKAERAAAARRQALADDLHDSILQTLFFLHVRLRRALAQVDRRASGQLADDLAEAVAATEDAYLRMRDVLGRLRAESGEGEGWRDPGSLRRLVETAVGRGELRVEIEPGSAPPQGLDPGRWAAVQSILLEALRNARKHAQTGQARLWVREVGGVGTAGVEDQGVGFGPETPEGFGLPAMRRRAQAAGLELRVDSAPGRGTRVEVSWSCR